MMITLGSFSEQCRGGLTRRGFLVSLSAILGSCGPASAVELLPIQPSDLEPPGPFRFTDPLPDVTEEVIPRAGITTGVAFGRSIQTLIAAGVLSREKFRGSETELPDWVEKILAGPSDEPIVFSGPTARYLVDLLWPLGLANKAAFNEKSPISTLQISHFASTSGWTLGREQNGYVYFNKVDAVRMTDQQQAMVLEVAANTYRPCCDNSTFYQDCNHGSALLGLLELAASQGTTLEGLYGIALTANSYWFPDNYTKTALYFLHFYRRSWRTLDPKLVLGSDFSSLSGWEKNVSDRLLEANVSLPGETKGRQAC